MKGAYALVRDRTVVSGSEVERSGSAVKVVEREGLKKSVFINS